MARSKSKRQSTDAARDAGLPQMDWQDVGRKLWARFIYHRDQIRPLEGRKRQAQTQLFVAYQEMAVAVAGDVPSFVLWLLRSRIKLTRSDREMLADLLEQNIFTKAKPIKKPRLARMSGWLAFSFYQKWKDANRRNGINDWGHRGEMKDAMCRLVIGLVRPRENAPTFEQVRELMERPATRREY